MPSMSMRILLRVLPPEQGPGGRCLLAHCPTICQLVGTVTHTKRILLDAFLRLAERPLETVEPHIRAQAILAWRERKSSKGPEMPTGTVKWFNATKGYGFIQPSDGSRDAFVHISAVERAGLTGLREGQQVEFELVPGRDGKSSAENIVALD